MKLFRKKRIELSDARQEPIDYLWSIKLINIDDVDNNLEDIRQVTSKGYSYLSTLNNAIYTIKTLDK